MKRLYALLPVLLVSVAACSSRTKETVIVQAPAVIKVERRAGLDIEVYDPVTGYIWEDVGVRIVEASHEWSGCICPTPLVDDFYYTDTQGLVLFDSVDLAHASVGFQLDPNGHAVMFPHEEEDEAIVVVEIWAPGMTSVFYEIDISWDDPFPVISLEFN